MTTQERAKSTYAIYSQLRDEKELTDYSVAKEIGVTASTFSDWKSGAYTPKLEKLLKLARYFNVPIECFLED